MRRSYGKSAGCPRFRNLTGPDRTACRPSTGREHLPMRPESFRLPPPGSISSSRCVAESVGMPRSRRDCWSTMSTVLPASSSMARRPSRPGRTIRSTTTPSILAVISFPRRIPDPRLSSWGRQRSCSSPMAGRPPVSSRRIGKAWSRSGSWTGSAMPTGGPPGS